MKTFKKYYKLHASPADVYNALTNKLMLEIWTGEKTEFSTEPNSEFSLWDGAIVGRNLEFIADKYIKQIWYFEDIESIVEIVLHADKANTSVEIRQNNIPDEAYDNIAEGWEQDYIGSLAELFNE